MIFETTYVNIFKKFKIEVWRLLNQKDTFLHEEMIDEPIFHFDIRFVNLFKLLLEMQLWVITTVTPRLLRVVYFVY